MRGCFTIHYSGETSPGSTPRSERLKPFLSGLRKVCDISIRLRHRTLSNPWVQDVLQWRVFEALLYSVRTDLRLADPAVTIFNACSSSVLKFRCFSCTVLTKLRGNSTIFLRAIRVDDVTHVPEWRQSGVYLSLPRDVSDQAFRGLARRYDSVTSST